MAASRPPPDQPLHHLRTPDFCPNDGVHLTVLSTGGGVAFVGDMGRVFRAVHVKTGKVLWETRLGTSVQGFPVTFSVGGKQYVAVSPGSAEVVPERFHRCWRPRFTSHRTPTRCMFLHCLITINAVVEYVFGAASISTASYPRPQPIWGETNGFQHYYNGHRTHAGWKGACRTPGKSGNTNWSRFAPVAEALSRRVLLQPLDPVNS
jgi:hypothetical protein